MGVDIKIKVVGSERVQRVLRTVDTKIKNFRPIWDDVGDYVRGVFKRQFSSQGASGQTGAWEPLTPAYAKWKEKNYPGRPILVMTGQLKRSVIQKGSSGNIYKKTKNKLVMGTENKLGIIHHKGYRKRGRYLPPRPIIDLTKFQFKRVFTIIQNYVKKAMGS